MSIGSIANPPQQQVAPVVEGENATAEIEELLVEEVSIDGMCGVY